MPRGDKARAGSPAAELGQMTFGEAARARTEAYEPAEPPLAGPHAAGADGHVRPIDRKHLARFTASDPALEEEILGLYLEQLPRLIEAMRLAATDREWAMAAHTLKGSSRSVGAWRLARLGEQAERIGGISNRHACVEAILRIEDAAVEARGYILETWGNGGR